MNTVSLAKDPFIRKSEGGGGGVTINNQEKSLEITENGTTEVTADSGFTGLSKVIVNTNVASSGGGGSDMPVIGDGKTYLYITIAAEGRMNAFIYAQSSSSSIPLLIDWGDGTIEEKRTSYHTHKYNKPGDYVVSITATQGRHIIGYSMNSMSVMGYPPEGTPNILRAAEVGSMASFGQSVFKYCFSLREAVILNGITALPQDAFYSCGSLSKVSLPNSVISISSNAFENCYSLREFDSPNGLYGISVSAFSSCKSLTRINIPGEGVYIQNSAFNGCTSLETISCKGNVFTVGPSAFSNCQNAMYYDFSNCTSVSSLNNTNAFSGIPSSCKIIVPDALYDEWVAATNWSTYASRIIKKSDWDASQS